MKTLHAAVFVGWALAAVPAPAQSIPITPILPPYQEIRAYLDLTASQWNAIGAANMKFNEWAFEKQRRISQVQNELAEETARSPIDPMALGVRYAEIETICREARDRAAETLKANTAVLTGAQRTKLEALEEALKLAPAISQAQSVRLMGGPAAAAVTIPVLGPGSPADRFSRTDGTRLGLLEVALRGCYATTGAWANTVVFRPAGNP